MSSKPKVALAFLAHHKPYLIMSTILSCLMQDYQDFDLFIIFNEGDGQCPDRPGYRQYLELSDPERSREIIAKTFEVESRSYQEYDELARAHGVNSKLSPFDLRIPELCNLKRPNVTYLHYENDHGLDAGGWIKFMRSGLWRSYDYVFMAQEGTTFTNSGVLSAALKMVAKHDIHMLYGGHMKGCMSKNLFLTNHSNVPDPQPIDHYHEQILRYGLEMFSRDPEMRAVLDAWQDDFPPQRQFHVVDFDASLLYRLGDALDPQRPLTGSRNERRLKKLLRELPLSREGYEHTLAAAKFFLRNGLGMNVALRRDPNHEKIVCDYTPRPVQDVVKVEQQDRSFFHREPRPEWFVCGSNHMFSRKLFEELDDRFNRYGLYEIIDLPFSCTVLEVVFAFIPAWLGVDKWFFDGYHRVTKDKITKSREDTVAGMARYLNRYYPGEIVAAPAGDFIRVDRLAPEHEHLRQILHSTFFTGKEVQ
jgi:hypothetical protein